MQQDFYSRAYVASDYLESKGLNLAWDFVLIYHIFLYT